MYEVLRAWRRQVAREHDVPAYTVFHDSTLYEIARRLPRSLEALAAISGIGSARLQRYGEVLLALIGEDAAACAASSEASRTLV
jgi:ATP-dependent DNA helicase RecQ